VKHQTIALSLLLLLPFTSRAHAWELFRSESSAIERGNEHLAKGQHKEALEAYDEAASELPNDPAVQLDRGLALLGLGKLGDAREAFRRGASGSAPKEVRGPALYNLGLTFLRDAEQAGQAQDLDGAKKLLEEAVDAFGGSLRAQPNNRDAAWNLELAKRRLVDTQQKQEQKKKEQEEQDKDKQKDQDKNQDPDKQKGDGDKNSDEPKPEDQQNDGGTPNDQSPDGDQGDQQKPEDAPDGGAPEQEPSAGDGGAAPPAPEPEPEPEPQEQSPAEAQEGQNKALPEHMQRALDALEAGEENLEKLRAKQRARSRPRRVDKDW
jgi:Ca-activated chloride channel homolog